MSKQAGDEPTKWLDRIIEAGGVGGGDALDHLVQVLGERRWRAAARAADPEAVTPGREQL